MMTRSFFGLSAVALTAALASAQQIQVRLAAPTSSGPVVPAKLGSTEFKPDTPANPDPKSLDVPAELQLKATELVRRLGSSVYRERELASRDLAKMGRYALPALAEAVRASDEPEVVERAEALLPKAQAIDMKARVACFLADAEGKYEHTLPGWGKFKEVAGNSKASRELFAEALKSKGTHQMLLAAERNAEEAGTVLSAYVSKLQGYNRWGGAYEQPTTPKTADLLIALFLEACYSDKEVVISMPWQWGGGGYYTVANNLYSSGDFQNALGNKRTGKFSEPITKVLQKWMDTRETANGCNQAWQFAQQMLGVKPALKYAARVLAAESNPNTQWMKQNILQQMGQQGAKDYVLDVAKCFEDSLIIWSMNNGSPPNHDIQLRDYALAIALQMTDQNPKDYGMDSTQPNAKGKNWNYTTFYFKDERDASERGAAGGPGVGRVLVRGGAAPVSPVKKEEDKKKEEEKKDDKEKKLSADDKRKVAFKKWAEWQAANVKDGKLIEQPKKEEPKKDEAKKDDLSPEDAAKEAAKQDALKKEAAVKAEGAKKQEEGKKEEPKKEGQKK
jgi:hypothetical protein